MARHSTLNDEISGVELSWQNIIMTVGLGVTMLGGFWYLAYIPISDMKSQITELRSNEAQHRSDDEAKFLTQKEHNEFKGNVHASDARIDAETANLRKEIVAARAEAATRADVQQALNTTRVEFLAEVRRLNDLMAGDMKRIEFETWRLERDKTISALQDRQNRFSEALDAMYSKLMQQIPSYQRKDN